MGVNQYKAFISYSHKDRAWAKWLHRKLESYAFPKHLIESQTDIVPIPRNLKPIFRDREELAAGHNLGEKIEAALKASENLIVICSPNAAQSHWVNQEILYFKRNNRGAKIFSVIIGGEPFASTPNEECFPDALKFEINQSGELSSTVAEPLAADLRSNGEGKRLGLLKLISGLAGLGVNDLVQRDLQRARKRVTAITVSAAAIILSMGGLTWTALDARNEAEQRRNDAEGQIEFMLTDLKDKLEGVGRLDALQVVGDKAANYYESYDLSEHDDDARGRRARVFHYLGEIQDKLGNLDEAESYFQRAYAATEYLLERNPDNTDRIFEHAQSAYWVGYVPFTQGKFETANTYFTEYQLLAKSLVQYDNENVTWQLENAYAYTNLGILHYKAGGTENAIEMFENSLSGYEANAKANPNDVWARLDLANIYGWIADSFVKESNFNDAINYRLLQFNLLENLASSSMNNAMIKARYLDALAGLARTELLSGNVEKAKKHASIGTPVSLQLWQDDRQNINWLQNYALFCLLNAELAFYQSDFSSMKTFITEYNSLTHNTLKNSNKNRFFELHNKRKEKLLSDYQLKHTDQKEISK